MRVISFCVKCDSGCLLVMELCFQRLQYTFWRWDNKKKKQKYRGLNQGIIRGKLGERDSSTYKLIVEIKEISFFSYLLTLSKVLLVIKLLSILSNGCPGVSGSAIC